MILKLNVEESVMLSEGLKDFVIDFVNKGVVPMVAQEVLHAGELIEPAEVEAAQQHVRDEVSRFFNGLHSVEEFEACIANLPTRNYLKLSMRQHILFARLRKTGDGTVQEVEAPASDGTLALAIQDRDRILGRLALHFGLTRQEVERILEMLAKKDKA